MPGKYFEFGPFRLDPAEHLLIRGDEVIQLPPKAFETLVLLVENSGHVLQKTALMEALWPDSFVEERNLSQNIFLVRKALGEQDGEYQYVKTVPRIGYRFVASVREILDGAESVVVASRSRERTLVKEEIVEREEDTNEPNAETINRAQQNSGTSHRSAFFERSGVRVTALILATSLLIIGSTLAASHFFSSGTAARNATKGASSATGSTDNAAAAEAYRNGRRLWNKRTSATLFESTSQFQLAIERDPGFALAYDGLADAYAFDFEHWRASEALAKKALDIDKTLSEPHATLGFIRTFWEWDWRDGERELQKAIELNPNYATAHQWYAIHLAINCRLVEAEVEMKRALELEPNSPVMNADMGQIFYFNQKYDEAIAACRKSLELDRDFYNAHQYLYEIYSQKGSYDDAFAELIKLRELAGASTSGFADAARRAYQAKGIRGVWQLRLEEMETSPGSGFEAAQIHARLGEKDKALSELEKAWHSHEFNMVFLYADPVFLWFHRDSRLIALRARMWTSPAAS